MCLHKKLLILCFYAHDLLILYFIIQLSLIQTDYLVEIDPNDDTFSDSIKRIS